MTNYERIKQMDIYEMAKALVSDCNSCDVCGYTVGGGTYCKCFNSGKSMAECCSEAMKKWLESEVRE